MIYFVLSDKWLIFFIGCILNNLNICFERMVLVNDKHLDSEAALVALSHLTRQNQHYSLTAQTRSYLH